MKIYMHWDMEGVSGLFRRPQTWYKEPGVAPEDAAEGIDLLIADVNSGVRAALDAGAERIFVCDTHGGGGNFVADRMLANERVTYHLRSRAMRAGVNRWMPDLDEQVDALMLMGHHAMAGTPGEFLPHTWNSEWADFRINGESVGEIGIEACYAGWWGIPTVLVHGTQAACDEAKALFPEAVVAPVKHGIDHDHAAGQPAEAARAMTAERIGVAMRGLRRVRPQAFRPSIPMEVTLRLYTEADADRYARKPHARRLDASTVAWTLDRQCDVTKWVADAGMD
jgi:D-amino peptidase